MTPHARILIADRTPLVQEPSLRLGFAALLLCGTFAYYFEERIAAELAATLRLVSIDQIWEPKSTYLKVLLNLHHYDFEIAVSATAFGVLVFTIQFWRWVLWRRSDCFFANVKD